MSLDTPPAALRVGQRRQYQHLIIERGATGYHVYDWDCEGDGETIRTLPTLSAAVRFIEQY